MAAIAYYLLVRDLIRHHGRSSDFARTFGRDIKGMLSILAYVAGVALSFVHAWLGLAMYFAVALTWFIPDRRVEKTSGPAERE